MPIFTAIAAFVTALTGFEIAGTIAAFAARTLLTIGISKLLSNRAGSTAAGTQTAGARVQLPPATNNTLPVVYGSAYVAPTITDAKISTDQKTMWYVCALSEVTSTMPGQTPNTLVFGNIYYNGNLVAFDGTDPAKVISLTNNANPPQVDTTISGNLFMYLFPNGSSSGTNTGGQSAIDIMSDSAIPVDERWNGPIYTTGGQSAQMANTAFMIVKIVYNTHSSTTNLGQINVQLQNPLNKPGDVLYDYFINNRYGCNIPPTNIDTASLTSLNTYSDALINYTPVGGGTASQPRYRVNGPIDTGQNCLTNLQIIVDSCDSWLQYSELTGKWKIVINQSYTDYTILGNLYSIDNNNLIGGIDVNPLDLNSTYNSLQVQYPDANIKDQTNYNTIQLVDYQPELMSPNEPNNQLIVQSPLVNNYIQVMYLGERRLLQSREDLVISCALDYSGIQITAGDVVRVTLAEYGWNQKLFRVTQVQETKDTQGFLGARIIASQYNDTIYANDPINDYVPDGNTGLTNPNISNKPGTPVFTTNPLNTSGAVVSFNMASTVPTNGSVIAMKFNLGNSANIQTHVLYSTVNAANGVPFTNGQALSININDKPQANYYGSVTAITVGNSGYNSNVGGPYTWGANLHANSVTYTNMAPNSGARQLQLHVEYIVNNGTTITTPVNVTGVARNYNQPVYLNGTTVSSTKYYPYYQGTSATTDGYIANSTGQYTPLAATFRQAPNGNANWWSIGGGATTATLDPGEQYLIEYSVQLVANTATTVQLATWGSFSNDTGNINTDDQGVTTQEMSANLPYIIIDNYPLQAYGNSVSNIGLAMRNLFSSTKVDVVSCVIDVYRIK